VKKQFFLIFLLTIDSVLLFMFQIYIVDITVLRYKLSNILRFIPTFSDVLVKEVFIYIWRGRFITMARVLFCQVHVLWLSTK